MTRREHSPMSYSKAAAALLTRVLPAYGRGEIAPVPQDESRRHLRPQAHQGGRLYPLGACPQIELWRQGPGVHALARLLHAMAWRPAQGGGGGPAAGAESTQHPELVLRLPTGGPATVGVATGDGVLGLVRVQPEGRRVMDAAEFMQGRADFVGSMPDRRAPEEVETVELNVEEHLNAVTRAVSLDGARRSRRSRDHALPQLPDERAEPVGRGNQCCPHPPLVPASERRPADRRPVSAGGQRGRYYS